MSELSDISRWRNRIRMSENSIQERTDTRERITDWFLTKYWKDKTGGKRAIDIGDMEFREINWTWAFIRSLQATVWSRNPDLRVNSPWWPEPVRDLMGDALNALFRMARLRPTMKQVLQDLGLGGFGVLRTGYQHETAWTEAKQQSEEQAGYQEVARVLRGEEVTVREEGSHEDRLKGIRKALAEAQQLGYPPEALMDVQAIVQDHQEKARERPRSPLVLDNPLGFWVARVPPTIGGKAAVGWEMDCSFADSRWLWMRWVRPIEEVKSNPHYRKSVRDNVEATASRRSEVLGIDTDDGPGDVKEWLSENTYAEGDVRLVEGYDVLDRHTGEFMTFAENNEEWLFNERYAYADLYRGTGFHVFELADHPMGGPGLTPIEAVASQIIYMNNTAWLGAVVAEKSTPATVVDGEVVEKKHQESMANARPGEIVEIKVPHGKNLSDAMRDMPTPSMSPEIWAGFERAQGEMALGLGFSDARMGGGEKSRTATAANVVAESTTEFIVEWSGRLEETFEGVASDMLQLLKRYGDFEDLSYLVGPERAKEWPFIGPKAQEVRDFIWVPDVIKADIGSSLPGRKENRMRKASEFVGQMVQLPGSNIRELSKLLCEEYGYDPERFQMSREEEAQRAAQQEETDSGHVAGGPEQSAEPAPDSGGQNQEDINNMNRQKAAQLAAAAR